MVPLKLSQSNGNNQCCLDIFFKVWYSRDHYIDFICNTRPSETGLFKESEQGMGILLVGFYFR